MHLLPVLGALEERHAKDPLAIIGVHSAKFDNEKDPTHILAAMERYGVRHPVLVDSEMAVWNRYGISSWPTLVLIRPNGRIAAIAPGEPDPADLERAIEQVMAAARADGTLASGPVLKPAAERPEAGPLAFPGKVAMAGDGRIFVSDSGHHRVLVLDAGGGFLDAIGSGLRGRRDGGFATAALDDPQGLAVAPDGMTLYVADSRAHVLLAADLGSRTVRTLAGTGRLGERPLGAPAPALSFALRSPWDVALAGRELYFAAAGSHQIGVVDLDAGTVAAFAGSGSESLADGTGEDAAFAQPSGLALAGDTLYVADSESSAVRAIDLRTRAVRTLTGTGLFDWSDATGDAEGHALLQHPLAVTVSPVGLIVADTYNSKLKRFSPDLRQIGALPSEAAGVALFEPGGLATAADGSVVVADTNHGRLLRLDASGKRLDVIKVHGVPAVAAGVIEAPGAAAVAPRPATDAGTATMPPGGPLALTLAAPAGFEFSAGAPVHVTATAEGTVHIEGTSLSQEARGGAHEALSVPGSVGAGGGAVVLDVRTSVCDAVAHKACYPLSQRLRVHVTPGAATTLVLPLTAPRR